MQAEDYEEVYTVTASSDTSHNQSDSETEDVTEVVTTATSHVTAPANPGTSTFSHVTKVTNQGTTAVSQHPNLNSKPVDSLTTQKTQKTPLTSRIKSQSSSDTLNSDKLRTSRRNSKSGKSRDQGTGNRRNSLTFAKRLSRSCDSLDTSGQGDSQNPDFGTSQSDGKQAGKLKAHRRKGRRAVTLHNLDTKQLMLILNLQMRYLEETKQYHSQKDLKNLTSPRRAITPQPSSHQPKIPQNIRSHTPQPYRRQNGEISQQEKDFYAQIKSLMQKSVENNDQTHANNAYIDEQLSQKASRNTNTAPFQRGKHNPYIHGQRGHSVDNVHYVTYSDNMLNLKGPKPKSRATVQDYFLPPQPLHRHSKNTLPPQPIRRQKTADQSLPEPVHRGKSAFHVVDCARNTSRSSSISSEQSDPPVNTVNTTKQRTHQSDYAEEAIRDNFQLNKSPYMFKKSHSHKKSSEEQRLLNKLSDVSSKSIKSYVSSEIPPPYTGPPSYFEFLSSCDTSGTSTSSSNQEEIYSRPVRRNLGQGSADDKYCFEIENKNLLKNERDKNYNIRQPNLDSVYGYTETLSDVQNCHGDVKFKGVKGEGNSSEGHSKNRHKGDLIRENVYNTPSKSKVKQCIVPEDYYTPIHKVSRHTPVYANAENVENANKLTKHVHNKDKTITSPIPNSAKYNRVNHGNSMPMGQTGKFAGYVYQERNQIAPEAKYHEYEDIYDPPESDEPILLSHKELNEMRQIEEKGNVQKHSNGDVTDAVKKSPKKNKVKPYTYPDHVRHIPDTENSANDFQKLPNHGSQPVDKPKYNIPAIVVNDPDSVEDDVFISDNVNNVHENGARKSANKTKDASHGVRLSPRGDNFELSNQIADEKYSAYCVTGQSANYNEDTNHMTRQSTNPNEDVVHMTGQSSSQNGANYMTADHVTGLTSQSSESDNERQVPEGTDESSEDLVDNSSEEECAETGV